MFKGSSCTGFLAGRDAATAPVAPFAELLLLGVARDRRRKGTSSLFCSPFGCTWRADPDVFYFFYSILSYCFGVSVLQLSNTSKNTTKHLYEKQVQTCPLYNSTPPSGSLGLLAQIQLELSKDSRLLRESVVLQESSDRNIVVVVLPQSYIYIYMFFVFCKKRVLQD